MTHIRYIPTLSLQLCETGPRWCKSRLNQSVNSAALKGVKGFLRFVQCRQIPSSPSLEKSQRWGSERTTGKPVCLHRVVFLFGGKNDTIQTLRQNHFEHQIDETAPWRVAGRRSDRCWACCCRYRWRNSKPWPRWDFFLGNFEQEFLGL